MGRECLRLAAATVLVLHPPHLSPAIRADAQRHHPRRGPQALPGADVPEFGFDDSDPDVLVITYDSARKLCALAEGFLAGAATHYGQTAELQHTQCMHDGHDRCVIRCRFHAA